MSRGCWSLRGGGSGDLVGQGGGGDLGVMGYGKQGSRDDEVKNFTILANFNSESVFHFRVLLVLMISTSINK